MVTQAQADVVEVICNANRYVQDARIFGFQNSVYAASLPNNPTNSSMEPDLGGIEQGYSATEWKFGGSSYPVAQVLRIPYSYIDKNGIKVRSHFLIGFEGVGGGP